MSKKIIVPVLIAAMLAGSMPVLAQEHGNRSDRDSRWHPQGEERYQRGDDRYPRDERYQRDTRRQGERDRRDGRGAQGGWGRTSDFNAGYDGAGPDHDMRRGDRLPGRYRTHQYVVDNWRAHHLRQPPRGHHWVQVGADYVLVAAATGIIVQTVMEH